MARSSGDRGNLAPWIAAAIKQGLSANESLRALRAEGRGLRRETYLDLYAQVADNLRLKAGGADREGGRRPYAREILFAPSTVAVGYMQYVDIWVRDTSTGEVYPRPYGLRTDNLMTHDDAIATALDRYQDHAADYGETILGASYMATYLFAPGE